MSQLSERCDGHKKDIGMIEGAVIAAREVQKLSDSMTVLMKV